MLLTEEKEEKKENAISNSNYNLQNQNIINTVKDLHILKTYLILIGLFILILLLTFIGFSFYVYKSSTFANGILVKDIDISGLTYNKAKIKIENYLNDNMAENITLKHNDYTTTINMEQLEATFDIAGSLDIAYNYTRNNNFFINDLNTIKLFFSPINIEPQLVYNEKQLISSLEDISTKLPDTVIESSYYIDGNNLIITSGKTGSIVDINLTKNTIINSIYDLSYSNNTLEISTESKEPQKIDIDKIHNEIYKQPVNASYQENPRAVIASENGLDFAISTEEINKLLETKKDEYIIPLKTLYPNITTSMLGMEAFPDLLSTFSTRYVTSNKNRTTNLRLAANKINGTVIMPGETFSFNKIVGKRTIEAGYKDAAIYQDGKVIDGLAGGICQISSTLFNAVVYANLEITERRNHQFVPSYVTAGRDATVVYGAQDFKFKNTRNYPIKIICSVNNGIAKFDIYGLKESNEYEVVITSKVTSRTSKYIYSTTWKTLKQNGKLISSKVMCKDTYKTH